MAKTIKRVKLPRISKVNVKPGTRLVPEKGSLPVLFHFRPTSFEIVGRERHQEWLKLMREHGGVALQPDHPWSPTETISGSGGGWDDCDYW
jgi:hypothetical protein